MCLHLQSAKNAAKVGKNAAKGQDRDLAAREKALAKREAEVEARERALEAVGGNLKVGRGLACSCGCPIAGLFWGGLHRQPRATTQGEGGAHIPMLGTSFDGGHHLNHQDMWARCAWHAVSETACKSLVPEGSLTWLAAGA